MKLQITERGWAGHFILADRCCFRRNTLVSDGLRHVVISSVGQMYHKDKSGTFKPDTVGLGRTYETMVFHGVAEEPYIEADVGRQVSTGDTPWCVRSDDMNPSIDRSDDLKANDIHEANVAWVRKNWKKIHANPTTSA